MTGGWGAVRTLFLDTETTGVSVESDRIVTACASIVENGASVFRRSWLVAVDVDIPEGATAVHGISTEKARAEGAPATNVIPAIAGAVQYAVAHRMPVAVYNAPFDLTILDRELFRWSGETLDQFCGGPVGPIIDPLCVDKAVDRYRPGSRKLTDTCALFGVPLGDDAHDADADVDATAGLLHRMWLRSQASDDELFRLYGDRKFPRNLVRDWRALGRMTVGELHNSQIGWYREQSESFRQYLNCQANEKTHEADQARGRFDAEGAEIAEQESKELRERADGVRSVWPYESAAVSS